MRLNVQNITATINDGKRLEFHVAEEEGSKYSVCFPDTTFPLTVSHSADDAVKLLNGFQLQESKTISLHSVSVEEFTKNDNMEKLPDDLTLGAAGDMSQVRPGKAVQCLAGTEPAPNVGRLCRTIVDGASVTKRAISSLI